MAFVFRRSVVVMQRSAARHFTSCGPAAQGSAPGAVPPPPGIWARRLNKYEQQYELLAARLQGTDGCKWIGKGSVIGFVLGGVVGAALHSRRSTFDNDAVHRMKSLATELQEQSRVLQIQIASIQEAVNQLNLAMLSWVPPPMPPSRIDEAAVRKQRSDQRMLAFQEVERKLERDVQIADSYGEKVERYMEFIGALCDTIAKEVEENSDRQSMTEEDLDSMDDLLSFMRAVATKTKSSKAETSEG
ncbi:hypothetical protein H310_07370 [Aphanomyces invadans]|uniref:Uncharacterized protein n=1 Tax=Aphanomyces invadans TaxID=157072 RepID=A0A024U3M1_9STRA|nr:hypothetical protein H310_07370 [Aphanomyces invadans]ETW00844.1 hypothetical protein H310_07370 [Aphanomyces invadans]|eukprot:XP_008870979.1 hypothetical protein H310_07370 [Aphanomyces invadans]